MCHIFLLMPFLSLPIFWAMPLNQALPIYIVIVLISGLLYWLIWKAMRLSTGTGPESVIGTEAEVISKLSPGHLAQYLVRTRGELWSAHCADTLQSGEIVNVADLNGINLVVRPRTTDASCDETTKTEDRKNFNRANLLRCH